MSRYIKRKVRFPDEITHKRSTERFGLGLAAVCGAKGNNTPGEKPLRMTTVSRLANCPACVEILTKRRVAARERMATL